ncbi:MAG: pilus assembly FimT family protein [Candidatus Eiseniibacteriota bacterium]
MSLRHKDGFTLVELAVAVLIGGLLLALSVPTVNKFITGYNLRQGASLMQGEMRLARQRAVTNNYRVWVYYDVGINKYWTGDQKPLPNGAWTATTWRGPLSFPNRVRLSTANFSGFNYFFYTPAGVPTVGGTIPVAGSAVLATTVGQPDTVRINLDLSGSTWR